jgi:ubiquitin-protein ligase
MNDKSFSNFLECQLADGRALAAKSDILRLMPAAGSTPQQYIAEFRCKGVVQNRDGRLGEGGLFIVGIFFPADFFRRAAIPEVLTWLGPTNVFHPNILGPAGAICIGRLQPGTGLVDILYQIFEIIVYRKFNPREDNCLNKEACAWARNNQSRFPTDPRPLKRPDYLAQVRDVKEASEP